MAICWVRAGVCGQETTIQAEKTSQTKVNISLVTTCEHLQGLAAELQEIDFGSEVVRSITEIFFLQELPSMFAAIAVLCRRRYLKPWKWLVEYSCRGPAPLNSWKERYKVRNFTKVSPD